VAETLVSPLSGCRSGLIDKGNGRE